MKLIRILRYNIQRDYTISRYSNLAYNCNPGIDIEFIDFGVYRSFNNFIVAQIEPIIKQKKWK